MIESSADGYWMEDAKAQTVSLKWDVQPGMFLCLKSREP